MLDTFIGSNDGVPLVIPGQKGLMTGAKTYTEKEIPDYIEALEKPDLSNPGTIAHVGLVGVKLPGVTLEPITKMIICHYPEDSGSETRYEPNKGPDKDDAQVPITGGQHPDSCVFLYWTTRKMQPGEVRHMAFTYGLGRMSSDIDLVATTKPQQIGLTAGGAFRPGGVFTVTAYLKNATAGQKVTLHLPAKLRLAENQEVTQEIPLPGKDEYNQVSWRVTAEESGDYKIEAKSGGRTASYPVKIKSSGLFD
jgi:hypothetical protein